MRTFASVPGDRRAGLFVAAKVVHSTTHSVSQQRQCAALALLY